MCTYVGRDLTYSLKHPLVIKNRLANLNAITTQLACVSNQSCCMGQCSNRHRPIISCHAAKLIACDQCSPCSHVSCAKRSRNTGRPRSNHDHIEHAAFNVLEGMHYAIVVQFD